MRRGEIWSTGGNIFPGLEGPVQVVIVGSDALGTLPLRLVVPLLEWKEIYTHAPWMAPVSEGIQGADALQVRAVSTDVLGVCVGAISQEEMALVLHALRRVFEIED